MNYIVKLDNDVFVDGVSFGQACSLISDLSFDFTKLHNLECFKRTGTVEVKAESGKWLVTVSADKLTTSDLAQLETGLNDLLSKDTMKPLDAVECFHHRTGLPTDLIYSLHSCRESTNKPAYFERLINGYKQIQGGAK